ncbi:MAG: carotenoid oxygenase family protein [Chitinophagia bacterium]|jgi:hypothetical protein
MSEKKLTAFTFASRQEINIDSLHILDSGKIPEDMYGHVYMNSPVGTVNAETPIPQYLEDGTQNSEYGQPIFNGDGMVFRFDFGGGKIGVKSALMKTPCYYADEATKFGTKYYNEGIYFKGQGIARTSMKLGSRNQINTALNTFKFSGDEHTRITANFDAGRPFEINPETLEIKTAVGANKEWLDEFDGVFQYTFPLCQSTAHPFFDCETKEYFTVNFTKSLVNLLFRNDGLNSYLANEREEVTKNVQNLDKQLKGRKLKSDSFCKLLLEFFSFLHINKNNPKEFDVQKTIEKIDNSPIIGQKNAVWLLKWEGKNPLQKWRIIDEDGNDIVIHQTMHQTNYSKNYIILVDSSLKFALDIMFDVIFPKLEWLDELIRWITKRAILPQTPLYIIKRSDLQNGSGTVTAKKVIIPLETVHYSIDYDDTDDKITIHTSHNTASCAAEWIRPYDNLAINGNDVYDNTIGLITTGEMDIGRIGKFVIDGKTGTIIHSNVIWEKGFTGNDVPQNKNDLKPHTWAVGLNTYRDINSADTNVNKIKYNFWQSYGLDPRMLTKFIWNLYKDYQNRIIPTDDLLKYTEQMVPFCLFRQDTDTMTINEDFYIFKMNENLRSLQFVPRKRNTNDANLIHPQLDGYIFCTMVNGEPDVLHAPDEYSREIWIFDAANLKSGPICRLGHPDLQFAFTIHSIWTPDCRNTVSEYSIDVKTDYEWVINKFTNPFKKWRMKRFMKKNVYPKFK